MTIMLSRRSLIQAGLSVAGGLMIAAFAPEFAGATGDRQVARRGQRFRGHRPRQFHHSPGRQIRNGARRPDFDGDDCRRGIGMRLRQGQGRVRLRSPQPHRQQCLPVDGDGRFLLGAPFAGVPAAGGGLGGFVRHEASGRSATFGELAADAARVALAAEPAIKTPDQFRLIGEGLKRIDTPLKVTGAARFGIDTRLPGIAYAAAANCPVFGGRLKSYDFSAISGRRGIIAAVPVTNGVAVVADNFWRAKEAPRSIARSPTAAAMATSPRPSPNRRRWSRRSTRFRISRMRRWSR